MAVQSSQPRRYLLELPPELHLLIWEALWLDQLRQGVCLVQTTFHMSGPLASLSPFADYSRALAILLSYRKIYAEALPVLYGRVYFSFFVSGLTDRRTGWGTTNKKFPEEAYFLPHVHKASVESCLLGTHRNFLETTDSVIEATRRLRDHLSISDYCEYVMRTSMRRVIDSQAMSVDADVRGKLARIQWPGKIVLSLDGLDCTEESCKADCEVRAEVVRREVPEIVQGRVEIVDEDA